LTDLPNIGASMAEDLRQLGVRSPADLAGACPYDLYDRLNRQTKTRHDPCVLDAFISITRFVDGEAAQPWWHYTTERKRVLAVRDRATQRNHRSGK
jgi:hypothetical protein